MMNFANMKKSASSIFILSLGVFRGGDFKIWHVFMVALLSYCCCWFCLGGGVGIHRRSFMHTGDLPYLGFWDLASQQKNSMHLLTFTKPMASQFIHLFEFYSHIIFWRSNKNHSMIGKKFCSRDITIYPPGGKTFSACRMVLGSSIQEAMCD